MILKRICHIRLKLFPSRILYLHSEIVSLSKRAKSISVWKYIFSDVIPFHMLCILDVYTSKRQSITAFFLLLLNKVPALTDNHRRNSGTFANQNLQPLIKPKSTALTFITHLRKTLHSPLDGNRSNTPEKIKPHYSPYQKGTPELRSYVIVPSDLAREHSIVHTPTTR